MRKNAMRKNVVLMTVLTVSLVFALMLVTASIGTVSADWRNLITPIIPNETEATALGLEFCRISGHTEYYDGYMEARYYDNLAAPAKYKIAFIITLRQCDASDYAHINIENITKLYDFSCLYPNCQKKYELPDGQFIQKKPCYSQYRNGYTNFGVLNGETMFAHGNLLVKIESKTSYIKCRTVEDHQFSKSRHEWFLEQVVPNIIAGYPVVLNFTAYAYVETYPNPNWEDELFLEGTVMGPGGMVDGARVRYTIYDSDLTIICRNCVWTNSSGIFKRTMGAAKRIHHIDVNVSNGGSFPTYASMETITLDDFSGEPAETDIGMSLTVSTDKKTYSP